MKRTSVAGLQAAKGNPKDAKKRHYIAPKDRGHLYALREFSCPLCLAPNSLNVKLSVVKGEGEAVFSCVECKHAGRPGAGNILYPYRMAYHAKLQKRVDVYFRFRDYVSQCGLTGILANAKLSSDAKHESSGEVVGQAGMLSGFLDENGVERPAAEDANDGHSLLVGDDEAEEVEDQGEGLEGVADQDKGSRESAGRENGPSAGAAKPPSPVPVDANDDGADDDDGAFDDLFCGGEDDQGGGT